MTDSELWKKIRAARKFAELTQDDIGKLMNVSRSAIAMWEKSVDEGRTHPSVRQLHILAKATGVPAEFFWNDDIAVGDIYRMGDRHRNLRTLGPHAVLEMADRDAPHTPRPGSPAPQAAPADEDRRTGAFWSATEFFLPADKQAHLNMSLTVGGAHVAVSYCDGPNLLMFSTPKDAGTAIGKLLMYARALRAEPRMHLLLWGQTSLDVDVIREVFGVHIKTVETPTEAADYLRSI